MRHTYEPFSQEEPHNLRPFSFRSEGPADAVQFLGLIARKIQLTHLSENERVKKLYFSELFIETDTRTHESVVEFQSNMKLEEMQKIIRSSVEMKESHQEYMEVVLQTLREQPAHLNSMERDRSL